MKLLNRIALLAVGGLFIFSGLVKVNDPKGTAIKLEEYFYVFAEDIAGFFEALVDIAVPLAVILCVLEVVLGVALLVGYRIKTVLWMLFATIVFFTFLTFYSAYFDKVTDCGCFGDAIPLTPWQSFGKDVVLLVLIVYLLSQQQSLPSHSKKWGLYTVVASVAISMGIAGYALAFLPPIDFRDYKVGNSIPQLMQPAEPCRYAYIMTKNGQEFRLEQYPDASEGYELKEMQVLNPETCQAKIVDYSIFDEMGEDFTQASLQGNKLLIVIHNVQNTRAAAYPAVKQLLRSLEAQNAPITPVIFTSEPGDFDAFRHEMQLAVPFYYADATVLKAMIRANPGLVLLQEGKVLGKWPSRSLPTANELLPLLE